MKKKRSIGITILGVCFLLCVIPGLMAAFIGVISGPTNPKGIFRPILDIIIRILFILSPFMFFVTGMGVLKLKKWAWQLTIINVSILSVVCSVVIFSGGRVDVFPLVFVIIPSCLIIYYLTRSKVKEQFGDREANVDLIRYFKWLFKN